MSSFKIKIADIVFEIETTHDNCKDLCKDYLSLEDSDFLIHIDNKDIEYERKKSLKEAEIEGRVPEDFPDAYLETTAVYRKIAEYISKHNAAVMHGCLINYNNDGYLFIGRSGIGKTTHVKNWLKEYPNCFIVNGDKPILKIKEDGVFGYGTPWCGKENYNNNSSVKVKAIIMLLRDKDNHIEEVTLSKALPRLISSVYKPNTVDGTKKALEFIVDMGKYVKLYQLSCNMDQESAKVAYEGMNK